MPPLTPSKILAMELFYSRLQVLASTAGKLAMDVTEPPGGARSKSGKDAASAACFSTYASEDAA
jgi:hypothetical protein